MDLKKYLKFPKFQRSSKTSEGSLRSHGSGSSSSTRRAKGSISTYSFGRHSDRRLIGFSGSSSSSGSLRLRWPEANTDVVRLYLQKNPSFLDDFVKAEMETNTLARWLNTKRKNRSKRSTCTSHEEEPCITTPEVKKILSMMEFLRKCMSFPIQPSGGLSEDILRSADLIEINPPPNIENYKYDTLGMERKMISPTVMYMIEDLLGHYAFPRDQLSNFLAVIGCNYGDVAYHNYFHALCHTQSMYWILKKSPHVFTELEMKTLMIASVCHDLGHPGLTEDFLKNVLSETVTSYAGPLLEGFHLLSTEVALMSSDCYLFPEVDDKDFSQVVADISDCILSTCLARYNQLISDAGKLTENGKFDFEDAECRRLAKGLLMAVSDLASCWKPWEQHLVLVYNLCDEFYDQGEKLFALGMKCPESMDRKVVEKVPTYEIGFMDALALPLMKAAMKVFPCLEVIIEATLCNKRRWIEYLS